MELLPNEETQRPDAIEEIVCKAIEKCQTHPMDDDLSMIYMQLAMASAMGDKLKVEEAEIPHLTKIMLKRVEVNHTYELELEVALFLSCLAENPAVVVMYCWYLQYCAKKKNLPKITIKELGTQIFPMGFPSANDMHTIWDQQKVKRLPGVMSSDNLVDYLSAGQSLLS